MATNARTRDLRLQGLTLGEGDNQVTIPLGGEGVSALFSAGETGAMTRGVSSSIVTKPVEPPATLTITCFPEDDAYSILHDLKNKHDGEDFAGVLLPGLATVVSPGATTTTTVTYRFAHSVFTGIGDGQLGTDTGTVTFELAISGYKVEPVTEPN